MVAMQLSVDHVSLGVADLPFGISTFTALGFDLASSSAVARIDTETASVILTPSQAFSGLGSISIACEEPIAQRDGRLPLRFVSSDMRAKRPGNHPNGALRLERVYVAVPDLRIAAPEYASTLHMDLPTEQRGNVIRAIMRVFDVGPVGIVVAEPVEDGPAADALARHGAGLFQLLFRVRGLANVAHWMIEQRLPQPERGTRNTGESAILVSPEYACGAYVAFVGPE
jgi:hypothetical protein